MKKMGRPKVVDYHLKKNRCIRVSDADKEFIYSLGFSIQEFIDKKIKEEREENDKKV